MQTGQQCVPVDSRIEHILWVRCLVQLKWADWRVMLLIGSLLNWFNVFGYKFLSELGGTHVVVAFVFGSNRMSHLFEIVTSLEHVVGDCWLWTLLEGLDDSQWSFHLILLILFIKNHLKLSILDHFLRITYLIFDLDSLLSYLLCANFTYFLPTSFGFIVKVPVEFSFFYTSGVLFTHLLDDIFCLLTDLEASISTFCLIGDFSFDLWLYLPKTDCFSYFGGFAL